jgi:hypothetical protein
LLVYFLDAILFLHSQPQAANNYLLTILFKPAREWPLQHI